VPCLLSTRIHLNTLNAQTSTQHRNERRAAMHLVHILIATSLSSSQAFIAPTSNLIIRTPKTNSHHPSTALQIFGDDDEDSPIPPELRAEIYAAESRTPTAQSRPQRIATYGLLTFIGVTIAFFNAFLTSLRFGEGAPSTDLGYYGFGWVQSNFLSSFFFMNKIGGGLGLLSAGLFGTLAEVEVRSKRENAEKIWEEMQRRQSSRESGGSKKSKKNQLPQSSKRSMTGKQKKRLTALEELMEEENAAVVAASSIEEEMESPQIPPSEEAANVKKEDKGILSTIKNFYDKADSMAASQALLLNKELEDRGVIEKITDESGLKVIGKEAAAREKAERENSKGGGD
jgi:hypothetical protein